jgi:hypothetical protein
MNNRTRILWAFTAGRFGRPSERRKSLSMLLTASELPGVGWQQIGQRAWRMGVGSPRGSIAPRGVPTGAFTVVRRFRQAHLGYALRIQLAPHASPADAQDHARNFRQGMVTRSGVTRLEERVLDNFAVPGVEAPLVWEHRTARGTARGYQRMITGSIEHIAFWVGGSAQDPGLPWDELTPIATSLATKIRNVLGASSSGRSDKDR